MHEHPGHAFDSQPASVAIMNRDARITERAHLLLLNKLLAPFARVN